MKALIKLLSILLGVLFIFSGIIKLIDPVGTSIKLEEYFSAFSVISTHYNLNPIVYLLNSLEPHTTFLSVTISTLEIVLGFGLVFFWRPKLITTTTFLLLIFFGVLTAYSANCDPNNIYGVSCVTDCGCFGDFLPLKPRQSFHKDLVFLAICFPILIHAFRKNNRQKPKRILSLALLFITCTCIYFGVHTLKNLPLLDFRPYKIGNNIIDLRKNGKLAKIGYVMSKDGKEETFETYPYDQGYTFVKTSTLEEAVEPTAKDFYLYDSTGTDITELVLNRHFIAVVSYDINSVSKNEIIKLNEVLTRPTPIYCLSASSMEAFEKLGTKTSSFEQFYSLDQTVLKAIIRTNPGIIEIKNGIVLNKWTLDNYHKKLTH